MSDETSTTNRPPHINSVSNSGRSRKFSLITYLSETQLKCKLLEHSEQIRIYAYAYHDKDVFDDGKPKEPHFHVVIVTFNPKTVSAVRRWFSGYVDENGEITTTAQICRDVYNSYDYLTHNTKECRALGKYQYDSSIIVTNDNERFFKASPSSDFDNVTLAVEMLINGHHPHDVMRIFGRDFVYHYGQVRTLVRDIIKFEKVGYKDYVSFMADEIYIDENRIKDNKDLF